jgi:hypothetical protein
MLLADIGKVKIAVDNVGYGISYLSLAEAIARFPNRFPYFWQFHR